MDCFLLIKNGLHVLFTVNCCIFAVYMTAYLPKIPVSDKTYFIAAWTSLQLYPFIGFTFVWRQKYLKRLKIVVFGSWWGHLFSSCNGLGYWMFCSMKGAFSRDSRQMLCLTFFNTIITVIWCWWRGLVGLSLGWSKCFLLILERVLAE